MWAHNPTGAWTNQHQMTINRKRDDFTIADLRHLAREGGLSHSETDRLLAEVNSAVGDWPHFAAAVNVPPKMVRTIKSSHRHLL